MLAEDHNGVVPLRRVGEHLREFDEEEERLIRPAEDDLVLAGLDA